MTSPSSYVIVGAGVFGASTALELAKAGHQVIVLERSLDGYHAPDAASNDLNKIVRADYSDPHYRDLAKETISVWRRSPLFSPYYHETGLLLHSSSDTGSSGEEEYVQQGVARAAESTSCSLELPCVGKPLKPRAYTLTSEEEAVNCFPATLHNRLGNFVKRFAKGSEKGYINPRAGWAEADRATRAVLTEAIRLGARVIANAEVKGFVFDGDDRSRVLGVTTADGRMFRTEGKDGTVIMCTGAWTRPLLETCLPDQFRGWVPMSPSAQCALTVQLDEEQRKAFKNAPVVLNFANGFYCFEPDDKGVLKAAIHGNGFQRPTPCSEVSQCYPAISSGFKENQDPSRDVTTCSKRAAPYVPQDHERFLMNELQEVYPELGNLNIARTRICFYSESEDENWIIDHAPDTKGLVICSGDSGHAFKFLPILGTLVCARLGLPSVPKLDAHQERVFSFSYHAHLAQDMLTSKKAASADDMRSQTSTQQKGSVELPSKLRGRL